MAKLQINIRLEEEIDLKLETLCRVTFRSKGPMVESLVAAEYKKMEEAGLGPELEEARALILAGPVGVGAGGE